jgi:hypothetical protein
VIVEAVTRLVWSSSAIDASVTTAALIVCNVSIRDARA